MRRSRPLVVGMNDYIRVYRKIATSKTYEAVWGGKKFAAFTFEAYADTIAQTIAGDIWRGKQHGFIGNAYSGGTYYMDGRSLNTSDPELWAVGGAVHETEIALDEGEVAVYTEVLAACELLRETISDLQNAGVGDVYIGWWVTQERGDSAVFCFDVSNVVRGEDDALELGRERGEDEIYNFATGRYLKCAMRSAGGAPAGYGRQFVEFKKRNSKLYREIERKRSSGNNR